MTAPVFVLICGINGAGKSTLADALAERPALSRVPFLNPDRLAAGYRQAEPSLTRAAADFRALRHVAGEVRRLIGLRRSFVSETVGANIAYRRHVENARSAGFIVRVYFIGLRSVEQSIARVAIRVRMGGHTIPQADIRRRWPAVHANLGWFAEHANTLTVYTNAIDGGLPRVIAQVQAGIVEHLERDELPDVTLALDRLVRLGGAP